MARPINRLSARAAQTAGAGYHADGGGLYLLVTKEGTASWVFRYRQRKQPGDVGKSGRPREMGLGSLRDFSLAEARERAREARKLLADGIDPLDNKRAASKASLRLWGTAVDDFIADHKAEWKTGAQEHQWRHSLDTYGPDRATPVNRITTEAVLACLRPIWTTKTETATRVRGRIERVWDAEKVKRHVDGENPARWRGHLALLLAKPGKVAKPQHHAAMPYADLPALMAELASVKGRSSLALRWTILTAARTSETLGFDWSELRRSGPNGALWVIPKHRMKAAEAHEVTLPAAALALLDGLPHDAPPFALSNNAMLALLQRPPPKGLGHPFTVHGFRSSFYDWVRDHGHAPDHVADAALAHRVSDEVKAAYGRSTLLRLRRELMEKWAEYLLG